MSQAVQFTIGSERLIAEETTSKGSHTLDSFLQTTKNFLSTENGCFSAVNVFRRISTIFNKHHWQSQGEKFIAGSALPYAAFAALEAISLPDKIKKSRLQKMTLHGVADFAHTLFDAATAFCYARPCLAPCSMSVIAGAMVFDALSDASDVVLNTTQYLDSTARLNNAQNAPLIVQRAIENDRMNALIHIIRTVAAIIFSASACLALVMGHAVLSPVMALILALTGSIFNILAYYHKNYWCDLSLKTEWIQATPS